MKVKVVVIVVSITIIVILGIYFWMKIPEYTVTNINTVTLISFPSPLKYKTVNNYNIDDYSVPEFSPTSPNKYYKTDVKIKYYYNGPGVYLAEEGTEIRDLKLKKSLGTVPNDSYNPNGICGSTASAMMLRYLDTYFPGDNVPSSLEMSENNDKMTSYNI